MSNNAAPKPFPSPSWEGDTKIVLGIAIGTTESSVSFAFLENGASQVIHRVKWPGREAYIQPSKIPSVLWYDTDKAVVSFGAEALFPEIQEQAEDEMWCLARYFKLHLHPDDMKSKYNVKLDVLPPGVSLRQIYSDFLGYLLKHTRSYFEDRIIDGKQIWEQYSPAMEVVIAHPNGWGLREQTFLQSVAVVAGLSTSEQASSKVRFVSEAEASVHFGISHTNLGDFLQPGVNFAVCDAGGCTVDTTLYSVISTRPVLQLAEQREPACVQSGAIFVDAAFESFLRKTFDTAGLDTEDVEEYIQTGVRDFENLAKWAFTDETTDQLIRVAPVRFSYPSIGVRRGCMTIPGSTIKQFFDACVKAITTSVDQQLNGLSAQASLETVYTYDKCSEIVTNLEDVEFLLLMTRIIRVPKQSQTEPSYGVSCQPRIGLGNVLHGPHGV
ncbi:hypothetical protein RSAG8_04578, partial [Rhizoctonia solani AG-8 WAC10335]